MITTLKYYRSCCTLPFENLALEEYLLKTVPENTCVLYLWQNKNTVVIGRNQNCWVECNVSALENDGGYLARRLSGGGAVYHDIGNLNFTFLMPSGEYDLTRQLDVILTAVRSFGLDAEKSGRNDITVGGRKFSGNAFYHSGGKSYHHGTLLVNVDMSRVSKYLTVSDKKLASKGVSSVKSRIVNLSQLCSDITVDALSERLLEAFGEVYGLKPIPVLDGELDMNQVSAFAERYASHKWRFDRNIPFTWEAGGRFDWGEIQMRLQVSNGVVIDGEVYSDAMDEKIIGEIASALKGCRYCSKEMICRLNALQSENKQMLADIEQLISCRCN